MKGGFSVSFSKGADSTGTHTFSHPLLPCQKHGHEAEGGWIRHLGPQDDKHILRMIEGKEKRGPGPRRHCGMELTVL